MLSKKTRYAIMALTRLTREKDRGPLSMGIISEQERIPRRFLEGILLELKNNGFVESTRGKTGGYYLVKDPATITVAEIVTLFEGTIGMLACVCESTYRPCEFCKDETTCKIRQTFKYVHDSTSAILRNTTFRDLV